MVGKRSGQTNGEDHKASDGVDIVDEIVIGFEEVVVEMDVDSGDNRVVMRVDYPSKGFDACQS